MPAQMRNGSIVLRQRARRFASRSGGSSFGRRMVAQISHREMGRLFSITEATWTNSERYSQVLESLDKGFTAARCGTTGRAPYDRSLSVEMARRLAENRTTSPH